jgi:hypothetical protein
MNLKDVTGKYVVKNCGEVCTEWNYNTIGDDNFLHESNQQTKPLTPVYKNDRRITKRCVSQYLDLQTMDSVAMDGQCGSGWTVWQWMDSVAVDGQCGNGWTVWQWMDSVAVDGQCGSGWTVWQWMDSVAMKSAVCCDVTTCILTEMYPCFGGAYCLRLHRQ